MKIRSFARIAVSAVCLVLLSSNLAAQGRPPSPTGVKASDGTFEDRVRITWNAVSGIAQYRVYRCLDQTSSCGRPIRWTEKTTFDDFSAEAGRAFYYQVKACAAKCSVSSKGDQGYRALTMIGLLQRIETLEDLFFEFVDLYTGGIFLITTERTADFPVCFNASGELLPCASNVEPPPAGSLKGLWSGRMVYDRNHRGQSACYDGEALINVAMYAVYYPYVKNITVQLDGQGASPAGGGESLRIVNKYVTGQYRAYGRRTEWTLRFDNYGKAEGTWRETDDYLGEDCYGTWSFTKD